MVVGSQSDHLCGPQFVVVGWCYNFACGIRLPISFVGRFWLASVVGNEVKTEVCFYFVATEKHDAKTVGLRKDQKTTRGQYNGQRGICHLFDNPHDWLIDWLVD